METQNSFWDFEEEISSEACPHWHTLQLKCWALQGSNYLSCQHQVKCISANEALNKEHQIFLNMEKLTQNKASGIFTMNENIFLKTGED